MFCQLIGLFLILFFSQTLNANDLEPWETPQWLHLYQYKQSVTGQYLSDIQNQSFFFSSKGIKQPKQEYLAAIQAFNNTQTKWGIQKGPASCIFPARRRILEMLSGKNFPKVSCPDLDNWVNTIGAKQASLVFAGAYSGNPASILGHTFLRFYGDNDKISGQSLLSYSVGFLATPNPNDNRALYLIKGLTGGYPGYYNIEAHYMKVGLYNNSESRDLWEWPLNLNEKEVSLLIQHIWELTFNAQFRYYFINENCSYRILKAINVIRPKAKFSQEMGLIVVPSETIHLAKQEKTLTGEVIYRPSIKRKINIRLSHLETKELKDFKKARFSMKAIKKIKNPVILDSLIDYWVHTQLKKRDELNQHEKNLLQEVHKQRARLETPLPKIFTNNEIKDYYRLSPILMAHRAKLISIMSDFNQSISLQFNSGIQPAWMNTKGYQNIYEMEYLGLSYEESPFTPINNELNKKWNLLFVKAKSLSALNSTEVKWSWAFNSSIKNHCLICDNYDSQPQLQLTGAIGGAFIWEYFSLYLLPEVQILTWKNQNLISATPFGYVLGLIFEYGPLKLLTEQQSLWWKKSKHKQFTLNASYLISQNFSVRWLMTQESINTIQSHSTHLFGAAYFF